MGMNVEYPLGEKGSWDTDLCVGIEPLHGEVIVQKHRYSAFI